MKKHLINGNIGHRERAQEKFLTMTDTDLMPDYEFLELILMKAIPRIDVKPLAKELLNRFGSLSAVLSAPASELILFKNIKKSSLTLFKIIFEANRRLLSDRLKEAPILERWMDLIDYCCLTLQHQRIENFMVLYLDTRFRLLRQDIPQTGTTDRVSIYPQEILKQALILGAHAVVVVHNHPSGRTEPSPADLDMTLELYKTLSAGHIQLLDHLIIGSNRQVYSFSANGKLSIRSRSI